MIKIKRPVKGRFLKDYLLGKKILAYHEKH